MFHRRNHSRRNKQSFNTAGAEVLEERRMPSSIVAIDDVTLDGNYTGGVGIARTSDPYEIITAASPGGGPRVVHEPPVVV